jgi:hypothetical protein
MSVEDDYADLPLHARSLVAHLDGVRSTFRPQRVSDQRHNEFAERCRLLGDVLSAILLLQEQRSYATGFTAVRTALEHHLVDRLLFLANRYLQVYPVKKADIAAEEARLTSLQAGPRPDIVRWSMKEGRMNVIVRGLYTHGSLGRGATLSPYYFVVSEYNPFTGRARDVGRLAGAFRPIAERRRSAEQSKAVWDSLFVYAKLKRNLQLNRLITKAVALQLDVHYAFLSAFAHAMNPAYELVYGRNQPLAIGRRHHYAGELLLLYVIVIAAAELEAFARMAARAPRLPLAWTLVAADVAAAKAATSYFWFLHGEPQLHDRVHEVHTRVARGRSIIPARVVDPMAIPPGRVRYYTNPMTRLIDLHRGFAEWTTGLGAEPLFPRDDARWLA